MTDDRRNGDGAGPSDDDIALFREMVGDARPLHVDRIESRRRAPTPRAHFRRADDHAVLAESLTHGPADQERLSGEQLRFRRPELSARAMQKLIRGGYRVEAEADLHGLTAKEAKRALAEFLTESRVLGHRCVRVIHGKGKRSGHRGPVLKQRVDGWLRQWDGVLAFASARPAHGGTGAIYVLLKRT
ncbi:MAG: Smr/MutS family protein [Gammaproteobacteria bacterium]|jgi:DNA-nicking Smr family endonuclease